LNYRRNKTLQFILAVTGILVILGLLSWGNYLYATQNPGGNDFLVHWMGTRSFLTEGVSPYSDEAALKIQQMAYGRPAQQGEHELRVAYPLYSIVLFFPFSLISNFVLARALWMTLLEVGLFLFSWVCIRLADWRPSLLMTAGFFIFSILWYHAFRPLINGNAVILVALMVAGGLLALRNEADELAGVLFAFSTIKPQVVVLLILFVLIWGIRSKRWRLVGWLVGTIALLSASVALLMPDWILQNLREVLRYPGYNPPGTLQAALGIYLPAMGQRIGWGIAGVLGIILLIEWWLSIRWEFRGFLWTACLTLVFSQWMGIQTDPGNFIVVLPALTLIFALWQERWTRLGNILSISSLVILFLGIWALFLGTVTYGNQPQQSPIMFLPLPSFLIIALFWVRWWAVNPTRPWFDTIYQRENMWKR
jgi:hypothetical protein